MNDSSWFSSNVSICLSVAYSINFFAANLPNITKSLSFFKIWLLAFIYTFVLSFLISSYIFKYTFKILFIVILSDLFISFDFVLQYFFNINWLTLLFVINRLFLRLFSCFCYRWHWISYYLLCYLFCFSLPILKFAFFCHFVEIQLKNYMM